MSGSDKKIVISGMEHFSVSRLSLFSAVVSAMLFSSASADAQSTRDFIVPLEARRTSDSTFDLRWTSDKDATFYRVWSKTPEAASWSHIDSLKGDQRSLSIVLNEPVIDVRIEKNGALPDGTRLAGDGYVRLTSKNPPSSRLVTKILVVTDEGVESLLKEDLDRYREDLVRDGWVVDTTVVPSDLLDVDAQMVRDRIMRSWRDTSQARLTHVILIGAIPIPYSGGFVSNGTPQPPDGHPEHGGAWPSNAYYADMETSSGVDADYQWTDQTINLTAPGRPQNRNIPGDGKFDQSMIPTNLELCVGRVDMRRLPAFGTKDDDRTAELALLKRYLAKNHRYRTNDVSIRPIAIIDDAFGPFTNTINSYLTAEIFAGSGWRSYSALVGADSVFAGDFIRDATNPGRPALDTMSALFSYGCGGGGYEHCTGVITTTEFAANTFNSVFLMMLGSYFGDWDAEDNLMRSALASEGSILTCGWSGRPHWFLHPMGAGATFGECGRMAANNDGTYRSGIAINLNTPSQTFGLNFALRGIQINTLGDPTLRMPAPALTTPLAVSEENGVTILEWDNVPTAEGFIVEGAEYMKDAFSVLQDVPAAADGLRTSVRLALPSTTRVVRVRPYRSYSTTATSYSNIGYGSIAYRGTASVAEARTTDDVRLHSDASSLIVATDIGNATAAIVHDLRGNVVETISLHQEGATAFGHSSRLVPGFYIVTVTNGTKTSASTIVHR